jgi:hypothetical protein
VLSPLSAPYFPSPKIFLSCSSVCTQLNHYLTGKEGGLLPHFRTVAVSPAMHSRCISSVISPCPNYLFSCLSCLLNCELCDDKDCLCPASFHYSP